MLEPLRDGPSAVLGPDPAAGPAADGPAPQRGVENVTLILQRMRKELLGQADAVQDSVIDLDGDDDAGTPAEAGDGWPGGDPETLVATVRGLRSDIERLVRDGVSDLTDSLRPERIAREVARAQGSEVDRRLRALAEDLRHQLSGIQERVDSSQTGVERLVRDAVAGITPEVIAREVARTQGPEVDQRLRSLGEDLSHQLNGLHEKVEAAPALPRLQELAGAVTDLRHLVETRIAGQGSELLQERRLDRKLSDEQHRNLLVHLVELEAALAEQAGRMEAFKTTLSSVEHRLNQLDLIGGQLEKLFSRLDDVSASIDDAVHGNAAELHQRLDHLATQISASTHSALGSVRAEVRSLADRLELVDSTLGTVVADTAGVARCEATLREQDLWQVRMMQQIEEISERIRALRRRMAVQARQDEPVIDDKVIDAIAEAVHQRLAAEGPAPRWWGRRRRTSRQVGA